MGTIGVGFSIAVLFILVYAVARMMRTPPPAMDVDTPLSTEKPLKDLTSDQLMQRKVAACDWLTTYDALAKDDREKPDLLGSYLRKTAYLGLIDDELKKRPLETSKGHRPSAASTPSTSS